MVVHGASKTAKDWDAVEQHKINAQEKSST